MLAARHAVPLLLTLIAGALAGCATSGDTAPAVASVDPAAPGRCTLPPQLRRLGQHASYLAAGRTIRTNAADCRVRGGQFVADPAATGAMAATGADAVNIVIGGEADAPACAKRGAVATNGGNLTVRRGPGTSYAKLDSLANGRKVHFCDWSADETWVGVVYPTGRMDCGVDTPRREPGPYTGACRTGWISSQYVRVDN
jgi:hypothetical protein